MKVVSRYDANTGFVEVQACQDTRQFFLRQAVVLREFLYDGNPSLVSKLPPEIRNGWLEGLDAVERIAYIPSETIFIEPMAAAKAMNLTTASIISCDISDQVSARVAVLFLLASMTPIGIPSFQFLQHPLAWAASPPSDEANLLFDLIRDGAEDKTLFLNEVYVLFTELKKHPHHEPPIQELTAFLESRAAMMLIAVEKMHQVCGPASVNIVD